VNTRVTTSETGDCNRTYEKGGTCPTKIRRTKERGKDNGPLNQTDFYHEIRSGKTGKGKLGGPRGRRIDDSVYVGKGGDFGAEVRESDGRAELGLRNGKSSSHKSKGSRFTTSCGDSFIVGGDKGNAPQRRSGINSNESAGMTFDENRVSSKSVSAGKQGEDGKRLR